MKLTKAQIEALRMVLNCQDGINMRLDTYVPLHDMGLVRTSNDDGQAVCAYNILGELVYRCRITQAGIAALESLEGK